MLPDNFCSRPAPVFARHHLPGFGYNPAELSLKCFGQSGQPTLALLAPQALLQRLAAQHCRRHPLGIHRV
jgi:hypothetical protein